MDPYGVLIAVEQLVEASLHEGGGDVILPASALDEHLGPSTQR